ncbi:MAG TPA: hypothetical protein VNJ04_19560 [Gemmatimonadaceae bacterium]|nr:hypothetical protein [Gemmatimonadaceae bacterium]
MTEIGGYDGGRIGMSEDQEGADEVSPRTSWRFDATTARERAAIKYSDHVKELALQVWAFGADRNAVKTARMLADDHGEVVPVERIREWSRVHKWLQRAEDLYRDQAPALYDQTKFTLVASAPDAARYLHGCVNERPDGSYRIPNPDRMRILAADSILNRTGFLPMTRVQAADPHPAQLQQLDPGDDLAPLSDDDLRRMAAGIMTPG